jgi:hypothetical protein
MIKTFWRASEAAKWLLCSEARLNLIASSRFRTIRNAPTIIDKIAMITLDKKGPRHRRRPGSPKRTGRKFPLSGAMQICQAVATLLNSYQLHSKVAYIRHAVMVALTVSPHELTDPSRILHLSM